MYLGFLEAARGDRLEISASGSALLALPEMFSPEARILWIRAVLSMVVADEDGSNPIHPATCMLRFVGAMPDIEKRWLAFTFDTSSDSARELRRIRSLAETNDFSRACKRVSASKYKAANAVKILPSVLEQLGLITIHQGRCRVTADGQLHLSRGGYRDAFVRRARPAVRRMRRVPRTGVVVQGPEEIRNVSRRPRRTRSTEDQIHSMLLLDERTQEHQELVKLLFCRLGNVRQIRCSDDSFDLLATSQDNSTELLFEAKTVRGDGLAQARIAVGQLFFYELFDVAPRAANKIVRKVVVFNGDPGQLAKQFLTHCGVSHVILRQASMEVTPDMEPYFRR